MQKNFLNFSYRWFKNLLKLWIEIFFFKIPKFRTFFRFSSKTIKKKPMGSWKLILSEIFKILIESVKSCTFCAKESKGPRFARFVPKPLKRPSLAGSAPKPQVPSLAHSGHKPP